VRGMLKVSLVWGICMCLDSCTIPTTPVNPVTPRSQSEEFLFAAANGTVLSLQIDTTTGALSNTQSVAGPESPSGIGVNTDGVFIYIVNINGNVGGFTIGQSGDLTTVDGSPFTVGSDTTPAGLAIDPQGTYLYVTDFGIVKTVGAGTETAGGVSGFKINASTGSLSSVDNSPFPANVFETLVIVDPSGRFLYSVNASTGANLTGFSINPTSGDLSQIQGSPWEVPTPSRDAPAALAIDGTGKFLYVSSGILGLTGYSISQTDGSLTPITNSPFGAGTTISSIVVAPTGSFLYGMNPSKGTISEFMINDSNGTLTEVQGSPFPAGTATGTIVIDRSGQYLFAADHQAAVFRVFSIDKSTGFLTASGTSPLAIAGTDPLFLATY